MERPINREKELFDAALDIRSATERAAFLECQCHGDSRLRQKVLELLALHESAEEFFDRCRPGYTAVDQENHSANPPKIAAEKSDTNEAESGKQIGPYKLLQKIGEGGCGVVYMAEQQSPVRRRVALKIIKAGMDTRSVVARFEAERQALAMMDHPNIARVLDAGETATGRPFFVMELVNGIRITQYCDERQLDTRARLDLFIQVCHAIQHAHQKGIIHRDIKPSNILVTRHDGVPVPKVIDFGIAKAVQEPLTDKTLFTMYGHFVGTPAYMSPEQAEMSGMDVDTRSDIYSLGVLLYELLTGKTPFDQKELLASGLDEMRRTLRECEPHRPSTKLDTLPKAELTTTALHRHADAPKLQSLLRGDLDWIAMKALEKDRRRRYETANGLAMDVTRYVNNEPVNARPPSRIYRFQKLVCRNRGLFIGIGAVAVTLVSGLGASTLFFLRERETRQSAEQARANETELRRAAENREKITQAALLFTQGNPEKANALADGINFNEPTLEGAAVLRSLGEWLALQGRWQEARHRFEQLLQVDHLDGAEIVTLDTLGRGAALAALEDREGFEDFRRRIVQRFSNHPNPLLAERLLRVTLLFPLPTNNLAAVQPFADAIAPSGRVSIGKPRVIAAGWPDSPGSIHFSGRPAEKADTQKTNVPANTENLLARLELSDLDTGQPYSFESAQRNSVILAGGTDIWGISDHFVYAHTLVTGDFDIRMKVHSIFPAYDDFTRVGLMARESGDKPDSRHVLVAVNAANTFQVIRRVQVGAPALSEPQNPLPSAFGSNSWIRLQRAGNVFHAYISDNGVDWTQLYQVTSGDKPFADSIHIGIASCAHIAKAVATNVISDFGATPVVPVNFAVTLALMEYRRGNFEQSLDWCRRALAYPEYNAERSATAQAIMALADKRLGRIDAANVEVARALDLINARFANGLQSGSETTGGWLDWEFARVLLREAVQ
jgi:eukaryotic-like serine/threonine-protein kinase